MATITYKCPHCGGEVVFLPDSQDFGCAYCGSHFSDTESKQLTPLQQKDEPLPDDLSQTPAAEGLAQAILYRCPSCGAEIVTTDTTAASLCPYCQNPVVLAGRLSGEWKPSRVIPFAFDRAAAQQSFLDWCHSKHFIDPSFFSAAQQERLSGIYFPHWLVDVKVDADMDATSRTLRVWRIGDIEYTETKTYAHKREGQASFQDLSYAAMSGNDAALTEGVYPYRMEEAIPFDMAYLSGFGAERRNLGKETLLDTLHNDVEQHTRTLMKETVSGYSAAQVKHLALHPVEESWEYTLLPAWILTYRHKDKRYFYAMNGQTGKVFGAVPVSKAKLLALFAGVAAAVFTVMSIGGYLL